MLPYQQSLFRKCCRPWAVSHREVLSCLPVLPGRDLVSLSIRCGYLLLRPRSPAPTIPVSRLADHAHLPPLFPTLYSSLARGRGCRLVATGRNLDFTRRDAHAPG